MTAVPCHLSPRLYGFTVTPHRLCDRLTERYNIAGPTMASDANSPLDFDATQRRRPPVDLTAPENACLVVLYGPHLGKRFPITERVRLGRGADNDIVLPSPDVSRQHAELLQTGDGWIVRDLGSMNGTSVNGQEVPVEMRLFPNDLIDVGGIIFKLSRVEMSKLSSTTRSIGSASTTA